MTLGALGLVIGPWLGGALWATVPGLLLHLAATIWLVVIAVRAFFAAGLNGEPGPWHLITAYVWILAPVSIAPLIILDVPGFPGAGIEATAPQALVYGWVLQFGYALIPYFTRRALLQPSHPQFGGSGQASGSGQLGGSWFSLATIHIGSALVWASIFIVPYQDLLHGAAYAFYGISLFPIALQLWRIVSRGLGQLEQKLL
jgi:cytochrome c oxidase cbb3-type subunit I